MSKLDRRFLIYLLKKLKASRLIQECSKENSAVVDCCDYLIEAIGGNDEQRKQEV